MLCLASVGVQAAGSSDCVRQLQQVDLVHQEALGGGRYRLRGVCGDVYPQPRTVPRHPDLVPPVLGVPRVAGPGEIILLDKMFKQDGTRKNKPAILEMFLILYDYKEHIYIFNSMSLLI